MESIGGFSVLGLLLEKLAKYMDVHSVMAIDKLSHSVSISGIALPYILFFCNFNIFNIFFIINIFRISIYYYYFYFIFHYFFIIF